MRLGAVIAVAILVLSGLISGCLGADTGTKDGTVTSEQVAVITDPSGDAPAFDADCRPSNPGTAAALVDSVTSRVVPVRPGATRVPPVDLIRVLLADRPERLLITAEFASLDPQHRETAPPGTCVGTSIYLCWLPRALVMVDECLYHTIRRRNGLLATEASYETYCNHWWYCAWGLENRVEYGTPGRITWEIPRHVMPFAEEGQILQDFHASIRRTDNHTSNFAGYWVNQADGTSDAETATYALKTQRAPPPAPASGPLTIEDARGDELRAPPPGAEARAEPDLDLWSMRVDENASALTFTLQYGRVDRTARTGLAVTLGLPSGRVYEFGFIRRADGTRESWGTVCLDYYCDQERHFPVEMHVKEGVGGLVKLSVLRDELEPIERGATTRLLYAAVGDVAQEYFFVPDIQNPPSTLCQTVPSCYRTYTGSRDFTPVAPPYTFQFTSAPGGQSSKAARAEDASGDAELPPGFADPDYLLMDERNRTGHRARYDVTFAEASPGPDGNIRIHLGIANATVAEAPAGFDLVIYAVALATADGNFLIAHARNGNGQAESFCAPDTLVFAQNPTSPRERVSITGLSGGSSQRSFTFLVPPECLGQADWRPTTFDRLGAGTFLVREAARSGPTSSMGVARVDMAKAEGPFELAWAHAEAAAPIAKQWYEAPLGVENFWDILGIAGAIAVSSSGVILFQRRRHVLKRYLLAVEHAGAAARQSPMRREEALVRLRGDIKAALLSGHLTDSQYLAVENRLDRYLASARLDALAKDFGELPHRLLVRLQELLGDGELTPKEFRHFSSMLEDTELTRAGRDRIQRKLRHWMAQDTR